MNGKDDKEEQDSSLVKKTFELLEKEGIDLPLEDIKNLMKFAPTIKDMFTKVTDLTSRSSQNVFDVFKQVISVYQDELKREDLPQEKREDIYDRIDKHVMSAREQDESNKKFIGSIMGVAVAAVVGGAVKFGPRIIKAAIKK